MKKHLVVGLTVIAAAGALIMQTTPVQASTLVSTVGNPLPKFGGGDQQWLADAAKSSASNAVAGAVGGAVSTAVIGTPSALAGAGVGALAGAATGFVTYAVQTGLDAASSTSSSEASSTDNASTDNSSTSTDGSNDSSQTGLDSSGGTIARFGASGSPINDTFGILQNPGGTVSQPAPGGLTVGKLAKIGASRLD